jgi:hypothetical protein
VKLQQPAGFAKLIYLSARPCNVFVFILILLFFANVQASSLVTRALSIAELTRRSDIIVLGTVTSIASDWNVNRTAIETRIDLKIEEIFKGRADHGRITFHQLGGVVGEIASSVSEAASFEEGERVAVFLFRNDRERLQLVGFFQGKFVVERGPKGPIAVRRIPGGSKPLDQLPFDNFKVQVQEPLTK